MKEQVIRTERTHLMCPNMHFGIRISLTYSFAPEKIQETLSCLSDAHPFLRALIFREENSDLCYQISDKSQIQYCSLETEEEVHKAWSAIACTKWNVFEEGLLKVFSCPGNCETMVLFVAHHLLTDGRGLLELVCKFANCIAGGEKPKLVEERLIASQEDLPKGSELGFVSRLLVDRATKQWKKENHVVTYSQYLEFAAQYGKTHPIQYCRNEIDSVTLINLHKSCHDAGVSVNDWIMAKTYIETGAKKIIIAVDIRRELPFFNPGALGNYSTALGIVCNTKTTNPMDKAKEVHALVQKALSNPKTKMLVLSCYLHINGELLDATAISALNGFDSKAGRLVGGSMFGFSKPTAYSVTNLGTFENHYMKFAEFIPPASPAACATVGVLTLNGVLRTVTSINKNT